MLGPHPGTDVMFNYPAHNLPVLDTINGVSIVDVSEVLKSTLGENYHETDFSVQTGAVLDWTKKHGAAFYGASGDEFSLRAAVREAQKTKKALVVVENLS